jgi:leucyl-tRNA synthetase
VRSSYPKLDIKAISKSVDKADSKKAMPFINGLKRRLDNGESPDAVLQRKLVFDELDTLKSMVPGLMQTIRLCKVVEIVSVDEGGASGTVVVGEDEGGKREGLPQNAAGAEPGSPGFLFENI